MSNIPSSINLLENVFGDTSHKRIAMVYIERLENPNVVNKLLEFIQKNMPCPINTCNIEEINHEELLDRLVMFLDIDMSILDDSDKKGTFMASTYIIRKIMLMLFTPLYESNKEQAKELIDDIEKKISKSSFLGKIDIQLILDITGIKNIYETLEDSNQPNKESNIERYFIWEHKYLSLLKKLAKRLKEDYQLIKSGNDFINAFDNRGRYKYTIEIASSEKLDQFIIIMDLIKKRKRIITVKGGGGFWTCLATVLVDSDNNLFKIDFNRKVSKLRSKSLIYNDLDFFLQKNGFPVKG